MKNNKKILKIIKIIAVILAAAAVCTAAGFGIKYYIDGLVPDDVHEAIINQKVEKGGGEVRIMSSNVLTSYSAKNSKVSKTLRKSAARPRAKIYLDILDNFRPDVIGLQETGTDWFDELSKNEFGYVFLFPEETRENMHMTCMAYNTETTENIEKDNFMLEDGRSDRYRRIEWGLFKDKATGKEYIVTTTHLDLINGSDENREESLILMKKEAAQLVEFVNELKEKYNVPIYMTGDYNSVNNVENWRELWPEKTDEQVKTDLLPQKDEIMYNQAPSVYEDLCKVFTDTKLIAEDFRGYKGTTFESPSYDHIFTDSDNKISRYAVISGKEMLKLSDHFSIFTDAVL